MVNPVFIKILSQFYYSFETFLAEFSLFLFFLVGFPGFFFIGFFGFRNSWSVKKINRDCPGPGWSLFFRQGNGELNKALTPNKVCIKRRPQWIPSPGSTRYFSSFFLYKGIVHLSIDWRLCVQLFFN